MNQDVCQPCTTFRFPGARKRAGSGEKNRATCRVDFWFTGCLLPFRNENGSLPSPLW